MILFMLHWQSIVNGSVLTTFRIPYFFTASKEFPGKFMLSYLPRKTVRHEFVTVTPDGIRYRQQIFTSLNSLVKWFKEHFRDPIPGMYSDSIF